MLDIWWHCKTKSLLSWLGSKKSSEKLAHRPRGHLRISGKGNFPGTVVASARIQPRYFQSQGFWRWCSESCNHAYLCESDRQTWLDSLLYGVVWWSKGTAVAQWLGCCATNRKVAGSIPDGVTGIFHPHNPSDRTMALGSTQPLTEMSTRSISWG